MTRIQDKFDLAGRVAFVTGGAGLLGTEFCRTLAEAGAAVVVADVDVAAAERVAKALSDSGYQAAGYGLDVTQAESTREAVNLAFSRFGRLDILVNSAALDPKVSSEGSVRDTSSFESYSLGAWKAALEVNLTGMFLATQAAVKPMKEQGKGSIINICSTYGLMAPDQRIYQKPGQLPQYKPVYYSVTKAGVLGFTRYLAAYYAGTEIRVNALTPGGVYNGQDEEFVKHYSYRTIMGRMARKDEMNGGLLFLASDASSYMTGANLVIDGGWTAW
jgi:NAD(P)-dependent dehydrogenase (short-subunit alcohol dehydrogenase family)